ncbi:MAG: transporter [Cycloclasticus sp.]|nr:transporter [Cycloclasticus sp.]MBQ0789186.1 transporter [Cycloclasticus sp.]
MNKKKLNVTAIIFGLSTISFNAYSDHPSVAFGLESAGPINTISATPAPLGTIALGLRAEVINNDRFSTEQLVQFGATGQEGIHSVDRITSTSLSAAYGLSNDLTLSARLPYIERKNIRESETHDDEGEAHSHGNSSGFGDALLLANYRFYQADDLDISLLLGIKAPTGDTQVKDKNGERFETEFQPGTGAWDYLLGVALSQSYGPLAYHANMLYSETTEGSQHTEIGSSLSYNAAVTYRLQTHDHGSHQHTDDPLELKWDLSFEANGITRRENRLQGHLEDNSGGSTLFISPGIKVSANGFGGFISFSVPVIQRQKGQQTDIDNRIVAGISITL